MSPENAKITGVERTFGHDETIVSKTDLKGRITYANRTFLKIADYTEREVLGQPHSILRHPEMPRCIFKLLWDTLGEKREIFAYVVNRTKGGHHYWVYAHVTPSIGPDGSVVGYHSNRRVPDRQILDEHIIPLYRQLLDEEQKHASRKDGLTSSTAMLQAVLAENGVAYDEFVMTLGQRRRRGYRDAPGGTPVDAQQAA